MVEKVKGMADFLGVEDNRPLWCFLGIMDGLIDN